MGCICVLLPFDGIHTHTYTLAKTAEKEGEQNRGLTAWDGNTTQSIQPSLREMIRFVMRRGVVVEEKDFSEACAFCPFEIPKVHIHKNGNEILRRRINCKSTHDNDELSL
jgi:hypothetical protein